ncbi:MAG: MFS transporter [Phycisphaerales bacterium]|nr:MFS transporter [Phycisphaerales bacterium]
MSDAGTSQQPNRLWNRGFTGLMLTQVCGATNDNLLKSILLLAFATGGTWAGTLGKGGPGWVSFMLSAPFVVLLGYAGQLSDRYPKNRMVVITRIAEVPIAVLACVGFIFNLPWVVIVAFLLLASESAFFSPSKYGVIREYTGVDELSRANGLLNASTNVAVIVGMVGGGYLLMLGERWVGFPLVLMAILGLCSSLLMPPVPAVNPGLKWTWNPFKSYLQSIRSIRSTAQDSRGRSSLWIGVLAWAMFYMIAIVVVAIIPEYQQPLGITTGQASTLMGALGIGIGVGCLVAAAISGLHIRLWLVPIGGFAMGIMLLIIGVATVIGLEQASVDPAVQEPRTGWLVFLWIFLLLTGFFGGFFIVPLQAMQQALAEPAFRARVLGTTNALSFLLMSLASATQALLMMIPGVTRGILMMGCGLGTLVLTTWMLVWGRSMFSMKILAKQDH